MNNNMFDFLPQPMLYIYNEILFLNVLLYLLIYFLITQFMQTTKDIFNVKKIECLIYPFILHYTYFNNLIFFLLNCILYLIIFFYIDV